MIENYSLHYCYRTIGDVLMIEIDSRKLPTRNEKVGNVVSIYSGDELIGINIFDFGKIVKIKNQGMIYLPTHSLIDVINSILANAKLPSLSYKEKSGYVVGEVNEIFEVAGGSLIVINLKAGNCSCFAKEVGELKSSDKVVVALAGSNLPNGDIVKERSGDFGFTDAHVCSYFDLGINESNEILIIDEDSEVGSDFFQLK